jgi:uncharacterized protein with von Willebrand factor type A (vWA) domain
MLVRFFLALRGAGVPVSLGEFLTLLEGLRAGLGQGSVDSFYELARTCLVKDERHFDRFDRAFAAYLGDLSALLEVAQRELPAEWLEKLLERNLTDEEQAAVSALGGWDELMQALQQRLAEQKERHEGGNRWIGAGGTSPFGAYGYNPEGVRIGQDASRQRRAVKVWDRREFANLDDGVAIGTRNMKLALRRLRRFARQGAPVELSLGETIDATARSGGWLDLRMVAQRRNVVKVLLLIDVGGSMDEHARVSAELFSAARSEFRHLEQFYFHNCPYERLWRDNRRRGGRELSTFEVLRTYAADYRLVLVGDATMSPYEITQPGGSVEHWNEEAGQVWLARLLQAWPKFAWLNPVPRDEWRLTQSIGITRELLEGRMYPLTLAGLDEAIAALR